MLFKRLALYLGTYAAVSILVSQTVTVWITNQWIHIILINTLACFISILAIAYYQDWLQLLSYEILGKFGLEGYYTKTLIVYPNVIYGYSDKRFYFDTKGATRNPNYDPSNVKYINLYCNFDLSPFVNLCELRIHFRLTKIDLPREDVMCCFDPNAVINVNIINSSNVRHLGFQYNQGFKDLNLDLISLSIHSTIPINDLIKIVERCKPLSLKMVYWTNEMMDHFEFYEEIEVLEGWANLSDDPKRFENMKKRRTRLVTLC